VRETHGKVSGFKELAGACIVCSPPPSTKRETKKILMKSAVRLAWRAAFSLWACSVAFADEVALKPCRLEHPSHMSAVDAECGKLSVLENAADPASRRIQLNIARVPAVSRRKKLDPMFVLAGGPGMGATAFFTGVSPAFARIRRDRDIVLVDQRGTGDSNGLQCELDEDSLMRASPDELVDETRRCLDSLTQHADPRFYTTSIAVKDLDRVRAALGYEQINVYGVSYGTRVAQHYVRRYPNRSRSVILDGVVPPELALGPSIALDAEAALHSILNRCRKDSACAGKFGNPVEAYQALRKSLQRGTVILSLADPTTGERVKLDFSTEHLVTVLRLASYSAEQAALLPLSLDMANKDGNYAPLASQFLIVSKAYDDAIAFGMHNSVVCSEDVPFYDPARIDRKALDQTFLGSAQVDALISICKVWPRGPVDSDFHAPLHSNVPALLLSGGNDPVTPAALGTQAAKGFTRGVHVVLSGLGHGQLTAPCVDRVMAQFVERGDAKDLDTSCTKVIKPMPFFTTLAGPPP
jgi:pimeloyl-ACP methyl ester carboxylesterase